MICEIRTVTVLSKVQSEAKRNENEISFPAIRKILSGNSFALVNLMLEEAAERFQLISY